MEDNTITLGTLFNTVRELEMKYRVRPHYLLIHPKHKKRLREEAYTTMAVPLQDSIEPREDRFRNIPILWNELIPENQVFPAFCDPSMLRAPGRVF